MSNSTIENTPFWQRMRSRLFPTKEEIDKGQAPKAEYLYERRPIVRKPIYDYVKIYTETVKSWVFRQISRSITQEVMNPGIELVKRYVSKCDTCLMEFDYEAEECTVCGGSSFSQPDIEQRKIAQALMEKPNSEYSFESLQRSALNWHLMLDDTYLSIAYAETPRSMTEKDPETGELKRVIKQVRIPAEVFVEDSRYLFPIADEFGKLGNNEYFCPSCYDWEIDNYVVPEKTGEIPDTCEECGGEMLQTCYVMKMADRIRQRFGEDEIRMANTDALRPQLQGNPKIISVWKQLLTINNMDDYNEEVYKEGTAGAIIAFPGMTQADVTTMMGKMQEEINKANKRDVFSGKRESSKKVHTLMIGVKDKKPEYMEVMPDPSKMQSLDYYKLYRDSICAVFGVTPIFVGVIESGKSGNNPRMQIDVQKGTTEEHQNFLEDLWNSQILPLFQVTDWCIRFNSVEQVDELREAQIWKEKATAAQTLINLGFVVTFDEHNNLEVSHEPEEVEEQPEEEQEEEEAESVDEEDISEESGEWYPKKKRIDDFPEGSAIKLREELLQEFTKILDNAKKVNDAKKSYAQAKEVMDRIHLDIIEASRKSLSEKLGVDLPQVPDHVLKKLNEIRNQRMKDFRKLLNEELKRKEE